MGQTLSEPVTTKEITMCQSSQYSVASCAMQGWRISMEDSHIHLLESPGDAKASFFGVYDGHGGARVSQYAGLHLHKRIINNEQYLNNDISGAIRSGFLKLDEDLRQDEETKEQMSGTTAVIVLVRDRKIYCGNCGDSRAVICRKGVALPLSYDHKPNNDLEAKRIHAAGGWVDAGRVNGNLALSRALGDFVFKGNDELKAEDQIVTALPDVVELPLDSEHEFIVIACDGIWDVLSSQNVVDHCRSRLAEGVTPEKVCEELVDRCLAPDCELSGVGCDNMTVVLICLLQGDDREAYATKLQREPDSIGAGEGDGAHEQQEEAVVEQIASNLHIDGESGGAARPDVCEKLHQEMHTSSDKRAQQVHGAKPDWQPVDAAAAGTTSTAAPTRASDDASSTTSAASEHYVTPSESPEAQMEESANEDCKRDVRGIDSHRSL